MPEDVPAPELLLLRASQRPLEMVVCLVRGQWPGHGTFPLLHRRLPALERRGSFLAALVARRPATLLAPLHNAVVAEQVSPPRVPFETVAEHLREEWRE